MDFALRFPSSKAFARLYSGMVLLWLILAFPIWLNQLTASLKGDWVDAAVSDVLTDKYGSPLRVRNVHFDRWCEVRFGSFAIDSKDGKPLVRAESGTLRLLRLDLSAKGGTETEVRFKNIFFTRHYYATSRAAGRWGFLLRKPIHIKELCFLIAQDRAGTKVTVTDCRSEGIRISGGIEVACSGAFRDELQVSVSPWTALRSMV